MGRVLDYLYSLILHLTKSCSGIRCAGRINLGRDVIEKGISGKDMLMGTRVVGCGVSLAQSIEVDEIRQTV